MYFNLSNCKGLIAQKRAEVPAKLLGLQLLFCQLTPEADVSDGPVLIAPCSKQHM